MRKVLLVLDDYNELTFLQSFLMKFGWDTKGIQRESLLDEEMLAFCPDIVVGSAQSRRLNGFHILAKIKKKSPNTKVILTISGSRKLDVEAGVDVDGFMSVPFEPVKVLKLLAKASGIDEKPVLSKYQKIARGLNLNKAMIIDSEEVSSEDTVVTGGVIKVNDPERIAAYGKFLDDLPDSECIKFDSDKIKKQVKNIKSGKKKEHDDLDRENRIHQKTF